MSIIIIFKENIFLLILQKISIVIFINYIMRVFNRIKTIKNKKFKMPQLDGEAFFSDFLLILILFFLLHSETTIFENFIRIRARQIYYLNLSFLIKNFKLEISILNLYLKSYISQFFKKINNTYLFKI